MNNKKIIIIFIIGFLCGVYPAVPRWVIEYISYLLMIFELYKILNKLK